MIDIFNIDKYVENNRIEAKTSLGGLPKSMWETYSAFANTYGGIILLGVQEYKNKSLHPVDLPHRDKYIKEIWNTLNDKSMISVNLLTKKDIIKATVNGKRIIVIFVPKARRKDRPVFIGDNAFTGTYRRNGEGDYKCTKDKVLAMMRNATSRTQDTNIINNLSFNDFCMSSVLKYHRRMLKTKPFACVKEFSLEQLLVKVGALKGDDKGALRPTFAGLLAFGKVEQIKTIFPNFSLKYEEFDNSNVIYKITSGKGVKEYNVYNFLFSVLARINKKFNVLYGKTKKATDLQMAFMEALSNALFNADYYKEGGVNISLYNEEVVFENAGSFVIDLNSVKTGGISDTRNAYLSQIFNFAGVGESVGGGIPKIYSLLNRNGLSAPKFSEQFNPDKIVLTLPLIKKQSIKDVKEQSSIAMLGIEKAVVVDYLTENVYASERELKDLLNASADKVKNLLNLLISEKIIEKVSDNKPILYKLKR